MTGSDRITGQNLVIHIQRWILRARLPDNDGRYACNGTMRCDVSQDNADRAYLRTFSDFNVTQDFGTSTNQDSATNFGMTIAGRFSSAAKRDLVQ